CDPRTSASDSRFAHALSIRASSGVAGKNCIDAMLPAGRGCQVVPRPHPAGGKFRSTWSSRPPNSGEPDQIIMRTLINDAGASAGQQPLKPPGPVPTVLHQTEPTIAAALFAAWSGDPAVVVASPPGAGKTRLVVHLAEQLHRRAQLKIAIAAQTRSQALDVANRTAAIGGRVGLLG